MRLRRTTTSVLIAGITLLGLFVIILSARLATTAGSLSFFGGDTATPPRIVLWAWERPTDLSFLNPRTAGVAFLARTIYLKEATAVVRPRLQTLNLPQTQTVIAVVRLESSRTYEPELSGSQREAVVSAIVEVSKLPRVSTLQIDFDATSSQRNFYRQVIRELRDRLPTGARLSITALASWCMDDDWISDLPIDEAVPMLFRMAADGKQIAARLDAGEDFHSPKCRHSYGISTDEPSPKLISSRRVYVFSPDTWTEASVRKTLESIK